MKGILTAITFLLALFLIVNVSASGFSPTSLIYNLTPNEKSCQTITLTSESDKIIIEDKWAENKDVEWKVSLFNNSASSHGITISYPKELTSGRQVEVCVSGAYSGEYHGVMLLKEAQVGNSVVQMGVWLKMIVSGEIKNPQTSTSTKTATSTTTQTTEQTTAQTQSQTEATTDETEMQSSNIGITGGAVGTGEKAGKYAGYFVVGIAIIFILVIIYKRWRRKRWENGLSY